MDGVGVEPTSAEFQSAAFTGFAYRPYRTVLNRIFISIIPFLFLFFILIFYSYLFVPSACFATNLADKVGLEPTTNRLTVGRSTY